MIEVRNLNHTKLDHHALIKTIQRYVRFLKLKNDILVVFDKRVTQYGGFHSLEHEKKRHKIQLCPHPDATDFNAIKWQFISYLLHELKHAQQIEKNGYQRYHSKAFSQILEIKDIYWSEFFSECEIEARVYENQHVRKAVDFYNSCC